MSEVAAGGRTEVEVPAAGLTGLMLTAAVVSAVSGLLYGYDTGIISGALLQISDEFKIGSGTQSVIAASILAGAVVGALGGSFLSERLGRKRTILVISLVFVVGTLACSVSPSPVTLVLSRLVLGLRGRRRHPDGADVRRRAGPGEPAGPARALLPAGHRGGHRRVHPRRGQRVGVLAGLGGRGRGPLAAHVPAHAAAAGEPALAGQARRPGRRPRGARHRPARRLRRLPRAARGSSTSRSASRRPVRGTAAGAACVSAGSGRR